MDGAEHGLLATGGGELAGSGPEKKAPQLHSSGPDHGATATNAGE